MQNPNIPPEEIYLKREEFGLDNSVKMLNDIIDKEDDSGKRQNAIKYLGLISKDVPNLKKECYDILENVLISEKGIDIKCEAAKALGKLNLEKALQPLLWIIEHDDGNIQLKLATLKAIKKLKFEDNEILTFVRELGSNSSTIRDFVRDSLLTLDPEKLVFSLLNSLKSENMSYEHKTELIKLMGYELASVNVSFEDTSYVKLKYPEVVSILSTNKDLLLEQITLILKEEDPVLMDSVITILKLQEPMIDQDIIKLLLNDDFIVKKNAIMLAGRLRIRDAVNLLIHNLDNIYNEVSIASIEALGEIGDLSAIPELLNVLDIEDISFEYSDLDMKLYIVDAIKRIYLNNKSASFEELYFHQYSST